MFSLQAVLCSAGAPFLLQMFLGLFFFRQVHRLTKRRQFVLHLQHHSLPDVLQQADDLIVAKLRQVDAIHGLDVVANIQLVAPAASHVRSNIDVDFKKSR